MVDEGCMGIERVRGQAVGIRQSVVSRFEQVCGAKRKHGGDGMGLIGEWQWGKVRAWWGTEVRQWKKEMAGWG